MNYYEILQTFVHRRQKLLYHTASTVLSAVIAMCPPLGATAMIAPFNLYLSPCIWQIEFDFMELSHLVSFSALKEVDTRVVEEISDDILFEAAAS